MGCGWGWGWGLGWYGVWYRVWGMKGTHGRNRGRGNKLQLAANRKAKPANANFKSLVGLLTFQRQLKVVWARAP